MPYLAEISYSEEEFIAAIRDYYRSLDAAAYPHVAAAAEALTHTPREAGFVEGLDIVLDGIDRTHRRSAR